MSTSRKKIRFKRKGRIRSKISGSHERPRLCIFRSLKSIYAQVIDDRRGITLVSARLAEVKNSKNDINGAKKLGHLIAEKCNEAKIKKLVFDRCGYQYHGKIMALTAAVREKGIEI